MPSSVERALADALSLEHPDIPWTPPAVLPSTGELHQAIAVLTVPPVTHAHATWCFGKLLLAFEPGSKATGAESVARCKLWIEANADLGDELWSKATLAAIRGSKWMPKPAEFRTLVEADLADRAKKLQRARAMLEALTGKPAHEPTEKPLGTRIERLRHTRSIYERMGRTMDVERIDREISAEERKADPNSCAKHQPSTPVPTVERAPFQPIDTPQNRRLAALAAEQRTPDDYRYVPE